MSPELPEQPEDWEVKPGQLGVGHIATLTEYEEPVEIKKNPIGFYQHQTKKKKRKKKRRG